LLAKNALVICVGIAIPDVTAVTSGMADSHRPAGLTEGISSLPLSTA